MQNQLPIAAACLAAAFLCAAPSAAQEQASAPADTFQQLSDKCHAMMAAQADVNETISTCAQASAEADKYPAGTHFIERRSAYVFYAAALLRARQYDEAEAVARRAVSVIKEGHDDDSGKSAAYSTLGNVEALKGKMEVADVDLTAAENYERDAIRLQPDPAKKAKYVANLKSVLQFHADVLDHMDRKPAAQAKRDEAAKL